MTNVAAFTVSLAPPCHINALYHFKNNFFLLTHSNVLLLYSFVNAASHSTKSALCLYKAAGLY